MVYLVSYDISDNRIRSRVASYLEKKGIRFQKSVFLIDASLGVYKKIKKDLALLSEKQGHIGIFRLCKGCQAQTYQIKSKPDSTFYFF